MSRYRGEVVKVVVGSGLVAMCVVWSSGLKS